MFLEEPPRNFGERWSSRPFRHLSVVQPPYPAGMDISAARQDKLRFLDNLWKAQAEALADTAVLHETASSFRSRDEYPVEGSGNVTEKARCYFSMRDREAWQHRDKVRTIHGSKLMIGTRHREHRRRDPGSFEFLCLRKAPRFVNLSASDGRRALSIQLPNRSGRGW